MAIKIGEKQCFLLNAREANQTPCADKSNLKTIITNLMNPILQLDRFRIKNVNLLKRKQKRSRIIQIIICLKRDLP